MKPPKPCLILIMCALALAGEARAQTEAPPQAPPATPLTIQSAEELLLLKSPILLRERQNLAIARAAIVTASRIPNPDLNVVSESYPLFEKQQPSFLNGQEATITIGQTIETAGKRRKRSAVARQDLSVTEASFADVLRQLRLELANRFYSVARAKSNQTLAREVLEQFDVVLRLNEARYKQGEISGLEFARLQTERARFFGEAIEADLQLSNGKAALRELLGVPAAAGDIDVVTEQSEPQTVNVQLPEMFSSAQQSRADLLAQRARVERERRNLSLQKALSMPDVKPLFGYKRDFGLNTVAFGVSLPVPLFNRNQGGISSARAQVEQQSYELQRVDLLVQREVEQAYQSLQAQQQRLQALQGSSVPSARRARDIAQTAFRVGALSLIEFLDAERSYRDTLRSYNDARYQFEISRFALQAAVGKELGK